MDFRNYGHHVALTKLGLVQPGMASPWSLMFGKQNTPANPALRQNQQQFQRMSMGTGIGNPAHPMNQTRGMPQTKGNINIPRNNYGLMAKMSDVRVPTPYEQTYQRQATFLAPTGATEEINGMWDEHDKRVDENTLPPFDSAMLTDGQLST